jgi:hypothetical protein
MIESEPAALPSRDQQDADPAGNEGLATATICVRWVSFSATHSIRNSHSRWRPCPSR